MNARRAATTVLLLFIASVSIADVTGTWNGSAGVTAVCSYNDPQGHPVNVPFSGTVNITLSLLQSGGVVDGLIEIDNFPNTTSTCQVSGTLPPLTGPLTGNISGSSLSVTATLPGDHGPVSVQLNFTVNGSSMSFNGSGGNATFSGSLNQTSTQPPASGLTGTYSGTFTSTLIPCGTQPPITFSGSITGGLIQAGNAISGSLTITGDKRDTQDASGRCVVVDKGMTTNLLTAQISGNSITGVVFNDHGGANSFVATVSGNTIAGMGTSGGRPGESFTFSITRSSTGTPGPAVSSFTANPSTINAGDSSTLSWSTINAGSASIDNGIGSVNASGSVTVSPTQTTTYTLTANGPGGTATATTTVTVNAAGPRLVVGMLPGGLLQATGASGATDSFTVSNVGTGAGTVTLTQSGNFFTLSPASFNVAPGASQVVGVTASAQPAGTYDGTITVSPGGITVPVRLLVAAPPTAPVIPQATVPRFDVSAAAGQNPSGSVSFKNNGSATLQGIAVSDVPWIVPQSGAITIAPGQTQQVTFNVDRSKRPDSAAPTGGATGKISLVYLTNASSKGLIALGGTPTGSVSVTVVDVVKPNVTPGSPPPLQSGEVALFVDGLRTANRFNGDLAVSSRGAEPISDLKLFLTAGGNPTQLSSIPSFPSNIGVSFPAIVKNVFGTTGGGSLQIRSSQAANISLSAVVASNVANVATSSATALPTLRSDRSIGAGERLVFSGAENTQTMTDTISTSVFIQEVSGNAGHVSFEYRDANGGAVGTDSGAVPAFAAVGSDAPAGTRSIIVTNDSTGAARLAGYAQVTADGTGDSWILTDPSRQWGSASGTLIMPTVQTPAGSQTDLYVTNASNSSLSVILDINSANRRHVVRRGSNVAQPVPQASTVAPMSTSRTTLPGANGFVRITAAAGSISAAGRVSTPVSGTSFGSSLPAVPASAALSSGQGRRFTGVDDSSAKTIAAATPATYRSTVMLIETAGQSATVRVTLRYTFIAGATVSSQGVSSRDFSAGPNQMLVIGDLARAIIGAQRDAFGDLRNMQVDIDVIDGAGKVLPFVESVDNGSGDLVIRAE